MPPLPEFALKIAGRNAAASLMARMASAEVDARHGHPSSFTLRLEFETDLDLLESVDTIVGTRLAPGTQIEMLRATARMQTPVLEGVVETVGVDLDSGRSACVPAIVIQGYDKAHLLTLEEKSRAFIEMRASDVAAQIAGEHGLSSVTDSSAVVAHLIQPGLTDWAFLSGLAERIGFEVFVEGNQLHFQRAGKRGRAKMTWGRGLTQFAPSLTGSRQAADVTVRGWDPSTKQTVEGVGKAGDTGSDGCVVQIADCVVRTKAEATVLAQSIADSIERAARTGTGLLQPGKPNLMPGTTAEVAGVGTTLGGAYHVDAVSHRFTANGYSTMFVLGGQPWFPHRSISDVASVDAETAPAIGIVVDNQDPSNLGRVRVRLPWLGHDIVTPWARLATPMGGFNRGVFLLPEVDDEVLVAFEHGDLSAPYVVGGLWNSVDRPPIDSTSGDNDVRLIRSRAGHEIRFDDSSGGGSVEVATSGGRTLRLDDGNDRIEIVSGDNGPSIHLDAATGAITLQSATSISIQSGTDVELRAGGNLTLEAGGHLAARAGVKASVEGGAMAELKSGGQVTVAGALVSIN